MVIEAPVATPFAPRAAGQIPSDRECLRFWDAWAMPDNIRRHSLRVAEAACSIADMAAATGLTVSWQLVRAAALLHDLGKAYTLRFGGNHSQIGASGVLDGTGNPALAQGIMHHVTWPGPIDLERHPLPLILVYSDKRVKHDRIVSLEERFQDLMERYGMYEGACDALEVSYSRARTIEHRLSERLEVDLHAHSLARRGVV